MAIVLKYGAPGPILESGFAAGLGQRQKQQTKNLLDVWQQQTQLDFQGQQAALHRQQQADLLQQSQDFHIGQSALDRLARQESETAGRLFQRDQTELGRQQVQKHYEDIKYQGTQKALADGSMALPPSAQKELDKLEEGRVLIQGPGWTDSDRAQFDADYQKRKRDLTMLAEPVTSPAAAANRDTVYRDQTGKAYDQPIEGVTKPYSVSSGKQIEDSQDQVDRKIAEQQQKQQEAAQVKQEKKQEAAAAAAQKEQDTVIADAKKLASEKDTETAQPKYTYAEALKEATDRHKQAKDFFSGTPLPSPASPTEENYTTPEGQSRTVLRRGQQAASADQLQPETGRWGDGQHGEPVTQPAQAAPTSDQEEAFNAQWATLKPGQSLRGPDGNIYIKQRAQ